MPEGMPLASAHLLLVQLVHLLVLVGSLGGVEGGGADQGEDQDDGGQPRDAEHGLH